MPIKSPIDTAIAGSRNGSAAMRDFTRQVDEAREKNGEKNVGKYLNEISGGTVYDKDSTLLRKPKNELGKDAFLKILMAQIQNQNPLDPMDSREMTAQMAQFSSLEQLVNMNSKMDKLGPDKSDNFVKGTNLIGMKVKANTNVLALQENKPMEIAFNLSQPVQTLKVSVIDAEGKPVREFDRTEVKSGPQNLKWDGRDQKGVPLKDGEYSYVVEAVGSKGEKVPIATDFDGVVSGVEFERGKVVLLLGDKKVRLSEVRSIQAPTPPQPVVPQGLPTPPGGVPSALPNLNTAPVPTSFVKQVPAETSEHQAKASDVLAARVNDLNRKFPFGN